MSDMFHTHRPVLLTEAVQALITHPDGLYIDATFGRGSHSRAILSHLSEQGRLIAFDKDPTAVAYAKQHFSSDKRFRIFHASFARMQLLLNELNVMGAVAGVLFDLGVSSPQLDDPSRGFSFSQDGKLDMRMDTTQGVDAMTWLASVSEKDLAQVLWQYGEEKFSRRIARNIVAQREKEPITTTTALANIIKFSVPRSKKQDKHPATRSFQAIRIAINQELTELEVGLQQAFAALAVGGRLAVISFHSLEDRIVKHFIRQLEKGADLPRHLPIKAKALPLQLKAIGKPINPNTEEVNTNPRARSAILRIAEKLI